MEPLARVGADAGRTLIIYKPLSPDERRSVLADPNGACPAGKRPAKPPPESQQEQRPTTSAPSGKYHKVKKGETLSSIAESYHITVAALKRDNAKLAANLRPGDVLVIRK